MSAGGPKFDINSLQPAEKNLFAELSKKYLAGKITPAGIFAELGKDKESYNKFITFHEFLSNLAKLRRLKTQFAQMETQQAQYRAAIEMHEKVIVAERAKVTDKMLGYADQIPIGNKTAYKGKK